MLAGCTADTTDTHPPLLADNITHATSTINLPPLPPYKILYTLHVLRIVDAENRVAFFIFVFFHLCLFSWVSGHLAGWRFWRKWTGRVKPTPCFLPPNPQPLPCRRGACLCLTELRLQIHDLTICRKLKFCCSNVAPVCFLLMPVRLRLKSNCRISRNASL